MKTLLWIFEGRSFHTLLFIGLVGLGALLPYAAKAEELPAFRLIAQDGRFQPETIVVPAGVRFKIVITNKGPGAEEFESRELGKELVLAPGVTRAVVFAPLMPGEYRFFGEFHPNTARGRIIAR